MRVPRSRRLVAVVLALLVPLSGCFGRGGGDEPAPAPEENVTVEPDATLPDGRGESAGLLETNRTEEGVGGVDHLHDYWKGREQIVLFDENVGVGCPPCMPDGQGTDPKAVAYVKLGKLPDGPEDALVYEGADRVEVLIGAPFFLAGSLAQAHPDPPAMFLQHRSAADADWTPPVPVTYDTPIVTDVTALMTDMPHSVNSLWVWRLTTDRPEFEMQVPMRITVHKGRDVVDWPGHPDFYAERDSRVVMQQHVTTHMSGIEGGFLYDSGGTWANPERLISWGTKEIAVFVNVTKTTNQLGASPTGYFLEVHNATIIGPEIRFGSRHQDVNDNNDLQSYHFAILVDEIGMDGPYQPASRWGFRMMATFADVEGVVGLCPGCFSYDIEYDITVLALSYETGVGEPFD